MHCLAESSERCLMVSGVAEVPAAYCEVSEEPPVSMAVLAVCPEGLLRHCGMRKVHATRVDPVSIPEVHLNYY